ncbi:hypothetical protein STCU_11374 [Strigomonas culicis]|uniref:Uncharacterized protein n=1 Tax=Strigomonas culicis TaxID=28005 RepID=S9UNU4_9TRYP|nr:hypothetical protein STCU_11374 [Strigomonas culicis]|eukprot:EPY16351.1 hypothetical protein STCU_11374 [Strigomonas culicis]
MKKVTRKWIVLTTVLLLFLLVNYRSLFSSSSSTGASDTESANDHAASPFAHTDGPASVTRTDYQVQLFPNASFNAPILVQAQANTNASPDGETRSGLKAVDRCEVRAVPPAEQAARTFNLCFIEDGNHSSTVHHPFLALLGQVSVRWPLGLSSAPSGTAGSATAAGVHVLVAHAPRELEALRVEALYVFATRAAARTFAEEVPRPAAATPSRASCAAASSGSTAHSSGEPEDPMATLLTVPLAAGAGDGSASLYLNGAIAAKEAPLVSFSSRHRELIEAVREKEYKAMAHFFMPLPLLGGADDIGPSPFCVAQQDDTTERGSRACSFYMVATGSFKFLAKSLASSNAKKAKNAAAARRVREEQMRVVTVATAAVANATGGSGPAAGLSFCTDVHLAKDFWVVGADNGEPEDQVALLDDDLGTTVVYMLRIAALYAFILSFVVGRWWRVRTARRAL